MQEDEKMYVFYDICVCIYVQRNGTDMIWGQIYIVYETYHR